LSYPSIIMSASIRVGRNDPCPCGSGKKHKACCNIKVDRVADAAPHSILPMVGLVATVIVLAGTGVYLLRQRMLDPGKPASTIAANVTAPTNSGTPTPIPVPVPTITQTPAPGTPGVLTPQPPGPVPPGKVWSPEHGHWHDIPGAPPPPAMIGPTDTTPAPPGSPGNPVSYTPQPPGPVPEGKVWSPEHGHWHDLTPTPPK
jgi:hypothetical protein